MVLSVEGRRIHHHSILPFCIVDYGSNDFRTTKSQGGRMSQRRNHEWLELRPGKQGKYIIKDYSRLSLYYVIIVAKSLMRLLYAKQYI